MSLQWGSVRLPVAIRVAEQFGEYLGKELAVFAVVVDPEVIWYGVGMVTTMMPLYYMQTLHQVFSNAVRGFGKSTVVMLTSVFGLIVCRQIFLAISMSLNYSVKNVYWGYPVGWTGSALLGFLYYYFAIRRATGLWNCERYHSRRLQCWRKIIVGKVEREHQYVL